MFNTIKPQDATEGCKKMLTTEGVTFIAEAIGELNDPIDFAFIQGLCAGLNFPTIPKTADVYGSDLPDYACNALGNVKKELMRQAFADGHVNVTIIELGSMVGNQDESNNDEPSESDGNPAEGDAE